MKQGRAIRVRHSCQGLQHAGLTLGLASWCWSDYDMHRDDSV